MKTEGYRVGIVGSSSLLGREILAVLKERDFPVSRLVTSDLDEDDLSLPVVDLREGFEPLIADENLGESELDFVFLAARLPEVAPAAGSSPLFLRSAGQLARATRCTVIDACGALGREPGGLVRVPFLEPHPRRPAGHAPSPQYFVSVHPAAIAVCVVLLRLAGRFKLERAVAHVFAPVSEIGSKAIEELQKQTTSLLSFQKLPHAVFGQQLAFNLLPRLSGRQASGALHAELERRIQDQVREYLGERAPVPALRLIQSPVFHSLALSLYVETREPVSPSRLAEALAGERVTLRRASEQAPSQVEAADSSEILVDAVTPDAGRPEGIWIWAVADNLRLAAVNAVDIAEGVRAPARAH